MKLRFEAKKAIIIGAICAIAYCSVYICRDILSALSPQLTSGSIFTTDQLGTLSSIFFFSYAIGQLINGIIGDKVPGKYMVSLGLILASFCLFAMPHVAPLAAVPNIIYGAMGFFLAMVYAPMTKLISENTEPDLGTRCHVAHAMASYIAAPVSGLFATWMAWVPAFNVSSSILLIMGIVFFTSFTVMEKKGMVKPGSQTVRKSFDTGGSIRVLVKRGIVKWTFIAMLTGIVRTAVLFWLPTYISQHLSFDADTASLLYTAGTSILFVNSFLAVFFLYLLKRNMDHCVLLFFSVAAVCFLGVYFIHQPYVNLALLIIGMIFSNCSSSIMWSRYCPSLIDTGMMSSATGFLDFCSYMAAAVSSKLFGGAVGAIGWSNLILIWLALMALGVLLTLPYPKATQKTKVQ